MTGVPIRDGSAFHSATIMGLSLIHICLDQVTAQVRSLVDGMAAGPGKFNIRRFGGTAIGGYKQFSVRLFRVADIINGRFQR